MIGQPVKGVQGDEEIVAFVQLEPGSELSVDELAEYASHQLVPYKRPSKIQFVLTMPLTPTGKVMKDDLTKRLASELLPSSFTRKPRRLEPYLNKHRAFCPESLPVVPSQMYPT